MPFCEQGILNARLVSIRRSWIPCNHSDSNNSASVFLHGGQRLFIHLDLCALRVANQLISKVALTSRVLHQLRGMQRFITALELVQQRKNKILSISFFSFFTVNSSSVISMCLWVHWLGEMCVVLIGVCQREGRAISRTNLRKLHLLLNDCYSATLASIAAEGLKLITGYSY